MRSAIRGLILLLAVVLTTGILSACGKKGPLYLPAQQQQTSQR